jgi:hypothetical protein
MKRRSPPQKRIDDHTFPVRLKVLVPERGFEHLLVRFEESRPPDFLLRVVLRATRRTRGGRPVGLTTGDPLMLLQPTYPRPAVVELP